MSKEFEFRINPFYSKIFFKPIRRKVDYFVLLLEAIRYISIYRSISVPDNAAPLLILKVDKNSRLLFLSDKKAFSVSFPFSVKHQGDEMLVNSNSYGEIDSVVISELLSLLKQDSALYKSDVLELAEVITEKSEIKPGLWDIFREVFFAESGYMRCDVDSKNENGKIHPLHHMDIFFSSRATVKVGLHAPLDRNSFLDIMDGACECYYLGENTE